MIENDGLISELSESVLALPGDKPRIVAIDGFDGVGKTVLADQLANRLKSCGRQIIRASVDGFHNPRAVRYRNGKSSPSGFYRDSYNYFALREALLEPLGPGGLRQCVTAVFDVESDLPIALSQITADEDSILILDGIFLHRSELVSFWDLSVFLKAPFEVSIPRGAQRGSGSADPLAESNGRYIGGQKCYLAEADPENKASIVVDHADLNKSRIINHKKPAFA